MEEEEIQRQIIPGKKIFTFSRDEVKVILLKAAVEMTLTKEEMYFRVEIHLDNDPSSCREWGRGIILTVTEDTETLLAKPTKKRAKNAKKVHCTASDIQC